MSSSPEAPAAAKIGEEAPHISLQTQDSTINLSTLRGKYVVLNFWNRSNPDSRVANHFYDRAVEMLPDDKVVYISVCTDRYDEALSRLISETDGNNVSTQYYWTQRTGGDASNIYTASGAGTWLISPQGVLLAHNPTVTSLASL